MTEEWLAGASDVTVYVTMGLLTVAMLAFAAHLALAAARSTASGGRVHSGAGEMTGEMSGGAGVGSEAGSEVSASGSGAGATLVQAPAGPPRSPSRRWGVVGMQFTWLATFALVAAIVMRALSVGRPPLGNMYEFALAAAAFTLVIYAVWSLRSERLWLGLFVTAPVLLILGAAMVGWYTEASELQPALNSIWLGIHVTVATLSVALFTVGAVVALLYLAKDRAERSGVVTGWRAALPSAATLERATYGLHTLAFPLWTFTLIAGAIWAEQAWGRYWGWDAKEVWTFVIWVVYAAYLHAHQTSGWGARKATRLAVAGMGCIIVNYTVVNIYFAGLHSYSGV